MAGSSEPAFSFEHKKGAIAGSLASHYARVYTCARRRTHYSVRSSIRSARTRTKPPSSNGLATYSLFLASSISCRVILTSSPRRAANRLITQIAESASTLAVLLACSFWRTRSQAIFDNVSALCACLFNPVFFFTFLISFLVFIDGPIIRAC